MHFSPPRLHAHWLSSEEHQELVRGKIKSLPAPSPKATPTPVADGSPVSIMLTTISMGGNFDAWINIQFPNGDSPVTTSLLVDSGNTTLIIPNGEDLVGVAGYTVLGTATEPWGCPANVVRGTVQIPQVNGQLYEIENCVFYACTGNNSSGQRTANFGAGNISPWSGNGWNVPSGLGVTMQSPLSYNTAYPYAEFVYAPSGNVLSTDDNHVVNNESILMLYSTAPAGYTMMDIIKNIEWMSVVPHSLKVGSTETGWPGTVNNPIAMVDTGGGPMFLSDPNGEVYDKTWPDTVACPAWASSSENCNCVSDRLEIGLIESGGTTSYNYVIDTGAMASSVQGLTAVMCKVNAFMMSQQGMNIGGISMLFNRLLINYGGTQLGLAPKYSNWTKTIELGPTVDQAVAGNDQGVLLGYDFYPIGATIQTSLTVSWNGLPSGATLYIQHGGSDGASVLAWSGPDSSTEASGSLVAQCTIKRTEGAAVPLFVYVFQQDYLALDFHLMATSNLQS